MTDTGLPMVKGPAPPTPRRVAASIRRTATIDTSWPDGRGAPMQQQGRARDLLTIDLMGAPVVLAEDRFTAHLSDGREILDIAAAPTRPEIARLVGARAGSYLRAAISEALPAERVAGTPLFLLLDDIAGASLVAGWAWSQWSPDWAATVLRGPQADARRRRMEGVCVGFGAGSPAFAADVAQSQHAARAVTPIDANGDPYAWHALPEHDGPASRRARRIDVTLGDEVAIDAHFQDSANSPSGTRTAVHEYLLTATADAATMTLRSIRADPRILPFAPCPTAILNLGRLVGTPLAELRQVVLHRLSRTEGCTHLNDMVRALAEVPQLANALMAAREGRKAVAR